jgi:hypothetical protein
MIHKSLFTYSKLITDIAKSYCSFRFEKTALKIVFYKIYYHRKYQDTSSSEVRRSISQFLTTKMLAQYSYQVSLKSVNWLEMYYWGQAGGREQTQP